MSKLRSFSFAAFVLSLSWLAFIATDAQALVEPHPLSKLAFAQLKYAGGQWNPRPHALRRLAFEIEKRTSIAMLHDPVVVSATDTQLQTLPFLYWAGEGSMAPLDDASVVALRRYLKSGGLIFIDAVDDGFEQSVRREMQRVLPQNNFGRVPETHVLLKTFYLVPGLGGRVLKQPFVEGVLQEDRLAVVLSSNDHGGAWARDDFGRNDFEVSGGEGQREMALRFGVNVVMYALCLDYKEDQVHIPFIMRKRR